MVRVKRGNISRKRHKKTLQRAKGFYGRAKSIIKTARPAVYRALVNATRDRREHKSTFRSLWIVRLHAALLQRNWSYSEFIYKLNTSGVKLNRKSLSELAIHDAAALDTVINLVMGTVSKAA